MSKSKRPPARPRRMRLGWTLVGLAGIAALVSYIIFPKSDAFSTESANQLHASMWVALVALWLVTAGGFTVSSEVSWRYDQQIRRQSPIDLDAYRDLLRAMMRRAVHHPTNPVSSEEIALLVKLTGVRAPDDCG